MWACEQALRLRPDDASTLAARGDHLFTLGRAAEAEETYRAAAARDPALRLEQKIASAHALRAPAATPSGEPAAAADALPATCPPCARRCTMPGCWPSCCAAAMPSPSRC